jgi:hypothetical protein
MSDSVSHRGTQPQSKLLFGFFKKRHRNDTEKPCFCHLVALQVLGSFVLFVVVSAEFIFVIRQRTPLGHSPTHPPLSFADAPPLSFADADRRIYGFGGL